MTAADTADQEETVGLAITGATGRMGGELRTAAAEREDVSVELAVDRADSLSALDATGAGGEDPVTDARLGAAEDLPALLSEHPVDVLVDFTVAEACVPAVEAAVQADVAAVIGTTGFDDDGMDALRAAAEETPVLKAANFARGVQVLLDLVGQAAASMEDYDVELLETHHNAKRDAPSGTAKRVLREIEGSRGGDSASGEDGVASAAAQDDDDAPAASGGEDGRVHGREGHAPRSEGEIGVHAVRAGDITGIHEVLLAGNHEELRLTHRAEDRGVFAAGALDAAAWLAGQDAGWYDFSDVLRGE